MRCRRSIDTGVVALLLVRTAIRERWATAPELPEGAEALGRLASGLEARGLGNAADVENMPDDEYQMRAALAKVIYEQG